MRKKIICILVCTLLLVTILPITGMMEENGEKLLHPQNQQHYTISAIPPGEQKFLNIDSTSNKNTNLGILDQLDQSQTQSDNSLEVVLGLAQSFKPSLPVLTRFSIYVSTSFDIEGDWTFLSYDISLRKGSLTGPDIITVNLPTSELSMGSTFWLTIYGYSIPVSPGTDYYIVIKSGFTFWEDGADMYWLYGTGDPYPNGAAYSYHDGKWWVLPGWTTDFCFKTYGETGGGGSNKPPNTPTKPMGPTTGETGLSYSFSTSATDPDGDQVKLGWDWNGNGTIDNWSGFYNSGSTSSMSHTWTNPGTYHVKVKARDDNNAESGFSSSLTVTITDTNSAPFQPSITGPTSGKAGTPYAYAFTSTDPDGDPVSYYIQWGDTTTPSWTSPQASGTPYTESHTWENQGAYVIQAKARDSQGAESGWTTLSVSMPKNKILDINPLILQFLENHLNLFPIMRLLLDL